MTNAIHLILVTQSQTVANKVKELVSHFPEEAYHLEWAFNAANLNHYLHSQDIALILLDQVNSRLTEFAMVLNRHPHGEHVPVVLLTQDDLLAATNQIKVSQHLNLFKTTSEQLYQTIKAVEQVANAHKKQIDGEPLARQYSEHSELKKVSILDFFTASLARIKTEAETKDVTIFTTYDDGLYNMVVDTDKLSFVLDTLLTHALDQTPQNGSVGLEVVGDRRHETLHITIWDTGHGIINEHILQTASPNERNTLSTAVNAVYEQEGTISARGIPNRGSSITISIPWLTAIPEGKSTTPRSHVKAQHIMIVEDHPVNADTISSYLNAHGFGVLQVSNGQEALDKVTSFRPDLILMDVHMPIMDGLEATRRIRANADPTIAQIPIIALTALAMSSDRKDCLEAGANEYISKPVSLRWLIQTIRMHLADKKEKSH